jgi:hypothetical protein
MFCPKCRYEYEDILEICPDCQLKLIRELPPEEDPEYTELITVFTTPDAGLLALAKSIFGDAGIDYYVKGETAKTLFAQGFMELQVHSEDLDEAELLMEDWQKGRYVGEDAEDEAEEEKDRE